MKYSYWNSVVKLEVEKELDNAGIINTNERKSILKFERRLQSLRNKRDNGSNVGMMYENGDFDYASELLTELQKTNHYKNYCKANGYCLDANIGDFMA